MNVPVITAEPFTAALAAAHEASRGITHDYDAPPVPEGSLVVTERCGDRVTILSFGAECRTHVGVCLNDAEQAARAWAEATGGVYEPRAA